MSIEHIEVLILFKFYFLRCPLLHPSPTAALETEGAKPEVGTSLGYDIL